MLMATYSWLVMPAVVDILCSEASGSGPAWSPGTACSEGAVVGSRSSVIGVADRAAAAGRVMGGHAPQAVEPAGPILLHVSPARNTTVPAARPFPEPDVLMNKRQLIDDIRRYNTTAQPARITR